MTKEQDKSISRRRALTRIGGLALVAYGAPAMTTLSAAHASTSGASAGSSASSGSAASSGSTASAASAASDPSTASTASTPSEPSATSGPSTMTRSECEGSGGTVRTRDDGVSVCDR